MDLNILVDDTYLYIRSAVLVKGENGYLLEKHVNGYFFTVGGKLKINEKSIDGARREVEEELGVKIQDLKFLETFENIYTNEITKVKIHEICFVYETVDILKGEVPGNSIIVNAENIKDIEIKPVRIKEILQQKLV